MQKANRQGKDGYRGNHSRPLSQSQNVQQGHSSSNPLSNVGSSSPLHSRDLGSHDLSRSPGTSRGASMNMRGAGQQVFDQRRPSSSKPLNPEGQNGAMAYPPRQTGVHGIAGRSGHTVQYSHNQGTIGPHSQKMVPNQRMAQNGMFGQSGPQNSPNNGLPPNIGRTFPTGMGIRSAFPAATQKERHGSVPAGKSLTNTVPASKLLDEKPNQEEPQTERNGSLSSMVKGSPTVIPQQAEPRNIFKENPNIYYFNGESLSRPLNLPPDIKKKRWIFVAIAMVIACLMVFAFVDQVVSAPAKTQEEMDSILSQNVTTSPPDLLKILGWSDKKIKRSFEKSAAKGGYSIIDITNERNSSTEMDLVKIPASLSEEEGTEMYSRGLSNLGLVELIELLYGGWDLNIDRANGLNISLHYADFKSSSPSKAIAQAIAAEGLSRGTNEESGNDDGFGNEYSSGSIMIKGTDYAWTVSSTYLNEVYSTSGIPEKATYVGVRVIRKAS